MWSDTHHGGPQGPDTGGPAHVHRKIENKWRSLVTSAEKQILYIFTGVLKSLYESENTGLTVMTGYISYFPSGTVFLFVLSAPAVDY